LKIGARGAIFGRTAPTDATLEICTARPDRHKEDHKEIAEVEADCLAA
jgi:hypothetical protein